MYLWKYFTTGSEEHILTLRWALYLIVSQSDSGRTGAGRNRRGWFAHLKKIKLETVEDVSKCNQRNSVWGLLLVLPCGLSARVFTFVEANLRPRYRSCRAVLVRV
ncbi:hypothetical protein F5H01DRAFT_323664 [Linnemannia elongata]|nr:hypothetical protein F5H01DRAFT_323664 [Linnemannia elongata]